MSPDKYSAVWVSHSSISDFLACPRSYYLKNVYRDPKNNQKIKLIGPALALGQIVHEVLESLSALPKNQRFSESLVEKFNQAWKKVSGKKGGFDNSDTEYRYKSRGESMMRKIMANPGPIAELSVKIGMDLPYFWLSEEENLILCGKIDWLQYFADTDSVQIIDFKTGRGEEDANSLQLPIYRLLVNYCQKRPATKASYWYLDREENALVEKPLPDLSESRQKVLDIAKQIKIARQINRFKCPNGEAGCLACRPYEKIIKGEAELIGQDDYGAYVYVLNDSFEDENREGIIL
jgi:CRISPR/Cas system-associated exonuclease Cas4 (RecB family)